MGANLRVVTLNLWGTEAPLDRRLSLALVQLRELAPDVICLQEVRPLDGRSGRTTADFLAEGLGMSAHYAAAVTWDDGAHPKLSAGQEGLAIIAKQIIDTAVLPLPHPRPIDARLLLSAQVATDGSPIWIHTTHLHYRLDDGVAREDQVVAVDEAIRARRTDTSPPQILCGDFNATPDSDEIRFLRGLTTLAGRRTHFQDAWLRTHPSDVGITWSSENRLTRPLRSLDIDRRIDYIFVTSRKKDGRGTIHSCEVALTERDGSDDETSICASDHYAVVADIQVVSNA
ncbi:MAG: endonuclease/exonuclease/phosphatase family protein [Deltaproteobacteria bacterium]|nr:endonuclease/exonuclease/phosphatase family protein [Deltaproteobacteria bacterium]